MKFLEIIIEPLSAFGTPLKGDTIFGHFFWQLIYDPELISGNLSHLKDTYGHEPIVVFSSAFPRLKEGWLMPRPSLPLKYFHTEKGQDCFETLSKRKDEKKKKWMLVKELKINLRNTEFLNDTKATELLRKETEAFLAAQEIKSFTKKLAQSHNAINRATFTTGEGFAPYQLENLWFLPGMRLSVFVLFNEKVLSPGGIKTAFERIGQMGFGRDASSGLGRFRVKDLEEHALPEEGNMLYTLGPYVAQKDEYEHIWYQPFVRFGRHGSWLILTGKPFKNPVLMADEGAVLKTSAPKGPYVGRALTGLSKAEGETIGQGFSIVLPLEGL
ncbi:type III-A CRISPR-associated RAMP protein Csm4 [Thermodesulfatator atlanticus]